MEVTIGVMRLGPWPCLPCKCRSSQARLAVFNAKETGALGMILKHRQNMWKDVSCWFRQHGCMRFKQQKWRFHQQKYCFPRIDHKVKTSSKMIETSNQSLNIMKPPCRLWTWPPALKTACCPWCRLAQVICWIELFDLDSTCRNVSLATFQKISAPEKKSLGILAVKSRSEYKYIKITLQNLFEHMIHMPSYAK